MRVSQQILLLVALASSCKPTSDEERQQIALLTAQKTALEANVLRLEQQNVRLDEVRAGAEQELDALRQDQAVLAAERDGRGVHYILHCSIRQIHYSLSIKKQLADAINEETFDLPTDKVSYDHAQSGSDLFDSFRAGSAIFKGSLGSWRIKVESKRIETDPR